MRIKAETGKMNAASMELLRLSRETRQMGEELDSIQHQLRSMKGFEECISAIQKQGELLSDITSGLVRMFSSINEVARLYDLTESKNAQLVEEQVCQNRNYKEKLQFCTTDRIQKRLKNLLNL